MATSFKSDLPDAPVALRRAHPRLHDLAYAYLKGLLLDGGLDPADRISSDGIGRALSISRAPVGDAIRRLTMDGLLEVLPQVGVRVVTPVPAEVADFYELFAATEAVIGRLAASRRTPAEAVALRQLLTTLASRNDLPDDPDEYFDRQLVGLAVRDHTGARVGTVSAVEHPPAQDLLIVSVDGEPRMIPFVSSLVPTVDLDEGYLQLADVGGLLEDIE